LSDPFFIVGAPRSGTTLVSAMLGSHSQLAVYVETNYYLLFRPALHLYGDLERPRNLHRLVSDVRAATCLQGSMAVPEQDEFLAALIAPTFEGVLATLLHLYARQEAKRRGGEKTPGHHAFLGEMLETFPNSPMIFLMRDPRDLVLSLREAFGSSLEGAAWAWNAAFESYQRFARSVHLVRYEQLVAQPAEQSMALCKILGEPYEPVMLRYFERLRKAPHTVKRQHRRILEPIDARFVGRFRQMPRADIEWIEQACSAGMEALGYEFAFAKPAIRPAARPGRVTLFRDRLRFYGLNRIRWQRAARRWLTVLRLRILYLPSWIRSRFS
jgi:hypothetical protein